MGIEVSLAAVGTAVLAGLGYLVLHVVGDVAAEEAKQAVLRRPSLAARRQRQRGLMKTGFLCAVLAFVSGLLWVAVVTNESDDDAADARMFLVLTAVLGLAAACVLAAWWRRAGQAQ